MEGVTDPPLRRVLCPIGGYDWCFSEFIRITDHVISEATLVKAVPELYHGGVTPDGTPVRVQFLGDNPKSISDSAAFAVKLGARGIDLNFGCPSRFVHHAGAMLLREPDVMHAVTAAVRDAVPADIPVSVKIRSGFAEKSELENILMNVLVEGVDEVTVHCRTRKELYKAEAIDWTVLAPMVKEFPLVHFVANGEINGLEDARACMQVTTCSRLMVGRGALMVPNLGHVIKNGAKPYTNSQILHTALDVLNEFADNVQDEKIVMDRTKQFLGYARRDNPYLQEFFKIFARIKPLEEGRKMLRMQEQAAAEDEENSA